MTIRVDIRSFVGKGLQHFKVVLMTEVYMVDDDELKLSSIGFFKDPKIAQAFAGVQVESSYYRTKEALVLTDGIVGFLIGYQKAVTIFDDEAEIVKMRQKVIAKLSPGDRKVLGFGD